MMLKALLCFAGMMLFSHVAAAAAAQRTEFTVGIELPCQLPVTPAVESALESMGVQYINFYVKPWATTPDEVAVEAARGMAELAERLGVDCALSCYVVDPPEEAIRVMHRLGDRFQGVVFDELAHCRLLNYHEGADRLADPSTFTSLSDGYERTLAGYRVLRDKHAALGAPVMATHVWPVLHHVSARAGFTVCPKICKEFYSTVSLAIGLGAALQYDRPLWVDVDLWYYDLVPGHPPEEMLSNLLLAYWLGADGVYIEGAGHNLTPVPNQGIPFSLMTQVTPDKHQLTAHGETLRRFIREYLPANPRPWTFRDVTPEVAIIRFPDSDHGQRYVANANEGYGWAANLYGAPNLKPNEDTEAWFSLWNLLTCGATGTAGLSHFNSYIAAGGYERPVEEGVVQSLHSRPAQAAGHRFFVPMNGVVVFDHLVRHEHLAGIPLLFLTGVDVSDDTMDDLLRCVREEGATLVVWHGLAGHAGVEGYEGGVREVPRGKGRIIVTDDFSVNALWQSVWPHMARPDQIRYRFGERQVVLWRVTDNEVRAEID